MKHLLDIGQLKISQRFLVENDINDQDDDQEPDVIKIRQSKRAFDLIRSLPIDQLGQISMIKLKRGGTRNAQFFYQSPFSLTSQSINSGVSISLLYIEASPVNEFTISLTIHTNQQKTFRINQSLVDQLTQITGHKFRQKFLISPRYSKGQSPTQPIDIDYESGEHFSYTDASWQYHPYLDIAHDLCNPDFDHFINWEQNGTAVIWPRKT